MWFNDRKYFFPALFQVWNSYLSVVGHVHHQIWCVCSLWLEYFLLQVQLVSATLWDMILVRFSFKSGYSISFHSVWVIFIEWFSCKCNCWCTLERFCCLPIPSYTLSYFLSKLFRVGYFFHCQYIYFLMSWHTWLLRADVRQRSWAWLQMKLVKKARKISLRDG